MTRKEAMKSEEIWWRLGAELDFLYNLALQIVCDGDYQAIMTKEILYPISQICALSGNVSRVRNKAENRMFAKTNFGSINTFYPPRESVKSVEKVLERTRKELSALGKRFMDWEAFLKQCCERLPPMYHSFLSNCTGATLSDGIFTLYVSNSPDSIILRRLNNQRVMDVLQELSRAEHVRMREGMPPQDNTPQPDEVSQGDAKKPVYQDNTADCPHTAPYCPECGHILIDGNGDNFNFCPDCGQKIDWQETQ